MNLKGRTFMNVLNKTSRKIIAVVVAGGALLGASSAFAQYAPTYGQPHMMPVGVQINVGWHGDRYYDGHRYWAHDDWMRHHPHDHDPYAHDHRPPPPRY
jgi:hypothetical protein